MLPYITKDNCKAIVKDTLANGNFSGSVYESLGKFAIQGIDDGDDNIEWTWASGTEAPKFDTIKASFENGKCPVLQIKASYGESGASMTVDSFLPCCGIYVEENEDESYEIALFSASEFGSIMGQKTAEGEDWDIRIMD